MSFTLAYGDTDNAYRVDDNIVNNIDNKGHKCISCEDGNSW